MFKSVYGIILALFLVMPAGAQMILKKLDDPFERWYLTEKAIPGDFEDNPLNYHPNFGYKHADLLFKAGEKTRAVYWMYHSQLRYRILLSCQNSGPWSTDYDTFVALDADINAEQNQWIGGDVQLWADTIKRVLEDYDYTSDALFKAGACGDHASTQIQGMAGLRASLIEDYETIREQRAANGYENRTIGPVTD